MAYIGLNKMDIKIKADNPLYADTRYNDKICYDDN